MSILPVITTFYNYTGSQKKVKLMSELKRAAKKWTNAKLYIVEVSYNGVFEVTNDYNKCHFQIHADNPFFHKEDLISYAARRIMRDNNYFAWMDYNLELEVNFAEILENLNQNNAVILQPWSVVHYLGPNGEQIRTENSILSDPKKGHIGYFWAMNKAAFEKVCALFGMDITGSGDYIFVSALLSQKKKRSHFQKTHGEIVSSEFLDNVLAYEDRFKGIDYGYLEGKIIHKYNGYRSQGYYYTRCEILKDFAPIKDLEISRKGLIRCINPKINQMLKEYFLSSKE